MDERRCKYELCNRVLVQRDGEAHCNFASRLYCNGTCRGQDQEHRPKATDPTPEEIAALCEQLRAKRTLMSHRMMAPKEQPMTVPVVSVDFLRWAME